MSNWEKIAVLGKNKFINRFYIYLFIVPVIAKLLSEIQSPLKFLFKHTKIELVMELPFNWAIFFYTALAFTIASLIYQLGAPTIIKENISFGSFLISKKGFGHIINYARNIGIDYNLLHEKLKMPEDYWQFGEYGRAHWLASLTPKERKYFNKNDTQRKIKIYRHVSASTAKIPIEDIDAELGQRFWVVYNYAKKARKCLLYLALFFYILGFAGIIWVLYEGIIEVWNMSKYLFN